MKCLFILLNLSLVISNVASLVITVQPQTLVGSPTLVAWSREDRDPQDLVFDLRFVQGLADVGLAKANIVPANAGDDAGTVLVTFPSPGQYVLKAVIGSPRNTVIGASGQIVAVQLTPSSSSAPSSSVTIDSLPTFAASTASTSSSAPTSTSTTSSTSQPSPTTTTSSSLNRLKQSPNLPAIVGGVIGGLLILGLLAFIFVFVSRRRKAFKKRLTFHKDMMVQRRVAPPSMLPNLSFQTLSEAPSDAEQQPSHTAVGASISIPAPPLLSTKLARPRDYDVEQGLGSSGDGNGNTNTGDGAFSPTPGRPLGTGHIVPSPRGPRPSIKRTEHTIITARPPNDPQPLRSQRQKDLADRIAMLREQMIEVQSNQRNGGNGGGGGGGSGAGDGDSGTAGSRSPDSARVRVLDDMQREMMWLRDQEYSPWALGLTDVLPPGHARYMTP